MQPSLVHGSTTGAAGTLVLKDLIHTYSHRAMSTLQHVHTSQQCCGQCMRLMSLTFAMEGQDLPHTFLAHHEQESVIIIIIVVT